MRLAGWTITVLVLASHCAGRAAEGLQAGAATVDITPPIGYPMWGYAARHAKPSVGVLDPLHARALVLSAGSQRMAVVSMDLGRAPTRACTAAIRKRVKEEAGVEHLFLVASHTHHGPVLELDTWPDPKKPYVHDLERKLGDVIIAATHVLRPACIGFASEQVNFNRNRHSQRADKPVDREMLVLRVEGTDGKLIAQAVNFAAHATLQDPKVMRISADYPGALAVLVEADSGAPCLFLQGAAGDLSPDVGKERGSELFGRALGRKVLALASTIRCAPVQPASLVVQEDDFTFGKRIDMANAGIRDAYNMLFFRDLVDFYVREYSSGVRPHLTTALLNGRIGFVGVSGEFFCGHSLQLKERARLDHLFFLGYCNDYQQYFPTIEAAAEGGYGADPRVAPVEVGAGERMMNQALIHLYKMRGKLANLPPNR